MNERHSVPRILIINDRLDVMLIIVGGKKTADPGYLLATGSTAEFADGIFLFLIYRKESSRI